MDPSVAHVDQLFDPLGPSRRHRGITVIADGSTPHHVDSVVEGIAATETGASQVSMGGDPRDEIDTTLVHAHLPKRRAAGIIDAGSDGTTIAEGPRFVRAVDHLDLV